MGDFSSVSYSTEPCDEKDNSSDEDEEEDVDSHDDPEYELTTPETSTSTAKKAKTRPRGRRYGVTEVEKQAMAQYIAEKRKCDNGWDDLTARLRWEEFAARPEVGLLSCCHAEAQDNFAHRVEQQALIVGMGSYRS